MRASASASPQLQDVAFILAEFHNVTLICFSFALEYMETTFLSGNHVLWYIRVMTVALQGNSQTYKGKPEYWLACYCTMNDAA